jgi:hypothetical protein
MTPRDVTLDKVKTILHNQDRVNPNHSIDSIHSIEMTKGKRAKRTIDKKRTNQDYYKLQTIHQPLLNHYENVDWCERDYVHDFSTYMERK